LVSRLGQRLKALRAQRSLTLEALSRQTGVSKSMLSKIERGQVDPTTNLVSRIAEGLAVTISQLIGGDPLRDGVVIRRADQPLFRDPETGFLRRSLSPLLPSRGIDFVENSLPPGAQAGPFLPHRPGVEEYLVVSEGCLELRLAERAIRLEAGDSIVFSGDVEHRFRNLSDGLCTYYIVIDGTRWH